MTPAQWREAQGAYDALPKPWIVTHPLEPKPFRFVGEGAARTFAKACGLSDDAVTDERDARWPA